MKHFPEPNLSDSEPSKKRKKKPKMTDVTGGLKDEKSCEHSLILLIDGNKYCKHCGDIINLIKKPTGILKDLMELKKYFIGADASLRRESITLYPIENSDGRYVQWSDIEAIINKYMNP